MNPQGTARRWSGPPLALQIMALLLGGLVVAQGVTLALTMLLPPEPQRQWELGDIARVLSGKNAEGRNAHLLQRSLQARAPEPQGQGWLTSERSRRDLARLIERDEAEVRLYFFTPLPFAGTTGAVAAAPTQAAPQAAARQIATTFGPTGFQRVQAGGGPGGPSTPGGPGGPGAPGGSGFRGSPGGFGGGFGVGRGSGGSVGGSAQQPAAGGAAGPPPGDAPGAATSTPATAPGAGFVGAGSLGSPTAPPPAGIGGPDGTGAATLSPGPSAPPGATGAPNFAPPGAAAPQAPLPAAPPPGMPGQPVGPGILSAPVTPPSLPLDTERPLPRRAPATAEAPTMRAPEAPPPRTEPTRPAPPSTAPANAAPPRADVEAPRESRSAGRPPTPPPGDATTGPATDTARPAARGLFGLAPAPFVEGDFIAAVHTREGSWMVVQPVPESFPNAWQRRVLLWFLIAAAIVVPVGWLFSRRLVRPIAGFARAADQLGRDPVAPVLALDGPAEIGRAAQAFNRMQARLRSFVDDRTVMIGAISHDLRTPLTRLRFRIEDAPDDIRAGMLDDVQEMEQMIGSVLSFIRDASVVSARERMDFASLVEDVVEQAVFVGKDVQLQRMEKAPVEVDVIGMRRVLDNLIENAVKYGHQACVRLFTDGPDAVVEIGDRGPGLPASELELVFKPFYRTAQARASHATGSGLGLAVCRSIARAHGGDVVLKPGGSHGLLAQVRVPLALEVQRLTLQVSGAH
ncbi:ATP-binding protein [Variovorax sp. OV700]|uniref:ATP-binding protein n=1 Tax=Variovorax sp. OV700 TaxID=1882826 RepID=UPI00088A1A75|nr:ATP-binding protein [Variovorax sp. OV700]SDH71832.1 Signal transduction histidine kinase [Variovorax sp. OV700]